ncbi:MAG: 2,3,4,5-tetrahydropyridine-2,6-dicarboxylate N-succinyltransferase, partial [Burkholderiaceae bacterium]|nr:2,3,4,5-tetrahydropyridine-2,6-dicarboxylate N-succinyltransferase [Burkholderiaceae bacterium]
MTQALQNTIDQAWENRSNLSPSSAPTDIKQAVSTVLEGLNNGSIRVAEKRAVGQWDVNQWVKKAVLLSFRLEDNQPMAAGGFTQFY